MTCIIIAFGLVKIDPSQILDLNKPSDRPCQELLNACFSFEIGNCILKLWPLKFASKKGQFWEKLQGYSLWFGQN